jgi:hypothetical protein
MHCLLRFAYILLFGNLSNCASAFTIIAFTFSAEGQQPRTTPAMHNGSRGLLTRWMHPMEPKYLKQCTHNPSQDSSHSSPTPRCPHTHMPPSQRCPRISPGSDNGASSSFFTSHRRSTVAPARTAKRRPFCPFHSITDARGFLHVSRVITSLGRMRDLNIGLGSSHRLNDARSRA